MPDRDATERDELLSRLRKIEGQIRGVQRMVEGDAYCIDVLNQIWAVVSGMEKVSLRLLHEHISGCVREAAASPDGGEEKVTEAVKAVERFIKSS